MLERLRKALLKLDCIKKAVEDYRQRQRDQRHHERWARLMSVNYTVRNVKPLKLDINDTLSVVGENGKYEERLGGKIVEEGWIDSTNWGRIQS